MDLFILWVSDIYLHKFFIGIDIISDGMPTEPPYHLYDAYIKLFRYFIIIYLYET